METQGEGVLQDIEEPMAFFWTREGREGGAQKNSYKKKAGVYVLSVQAGEGSVK